MTSRSAGAVVWSFCAYREVAMPAVNTAAVIVTMDLVRFMGGFLKFEGSGLRNLREHVAIDVD